MTSKRRKRYLDSGFQLIDGMGIDDFGIPQWATGSDMWRDFVANTGSMPNPTDTHAQTIYELNAAGVYIPFAANQLVRTDLGLQTSQARVQLLPFSDVITGGGWTLTNTPSPDSTITGAYPAPNGQNTARLFTPGIVGNAPSPIATQGNRVWNQPVAAVANAIYASGIWIKKHLVNSDCRVFVINKAADDIKAQSALVAATDQWQFIETSGLTDGASLGVRFLFAASQPVQIWNPMCVQAAFCGPPIVSTANTTETVNGNQPVYLGLGTQLQYGVAGFIDFDSLQPVASGEFPVLLDFNNGAGSNRFAIFRTLGSIALSVFNGGVNQGGPTIVAPSTPMSGKLVFGVANGFQQIRLVGGTAVTATTGAYPAATPDRIAIANRGYSAADAGFQRSRKIAFEFGTPTKPVNQAMFDRQYGKALAA